jgi:hypothetical protein
MFDRLRGSSLRRGSQWKGCRCVSTRGGHGKSPVTPTALTAVSRASATTLLPFKAPRFELASELIHDLEPPG